MWNFSFRPFCRKVYVRLQKINVVFIASSVSGEFPNDTFAFFLGLFAGLSLDSCKQCKFRMVNGISSAIRLF